MTPIHRRLMTSSKSHLEAALGHLDALLEEPDETPAAPAPADNDVYRAVRRDLAGSRHFGVVLTQPQADYLARAALNSEVSIDGDIFPLGEVPAYAARLVESRTRDGNVLKERQIKMDAQADEIIRLREALKRAKVEGCRVCGGKGTVTVAEYSSNRLDFANVQRSCPAPVHSL